MLMLSGKAQKNDEKKEHASMFFFLRGGMLEVVT